MRFRDYIVSYLQNLPGWKTSRKIVVIESDDWGSIRMPSRSVYDHLLAKGYKVDSDPFLKYDSLAGENDLSNLFEVLVSYKDKNGSPPVITANTIVCNPDFAEIEKSGFQEYKYEPFTETLKRYPAHAGSFELWKSGMSSGIFYPQFHGREHINVSKWMVALQSDVEMVREAFRHGMISISSEPSGMKFGYMEAYDNFSEEEKLEKAGVIHDGIRIFEKIFGYSSHSFIPCCFIWDNTIESAVNDRGIKYIQGIARQLEPTYVGEKHNFKRKFHFTGQKNELNQLYMVRNAYFEPSLSGNPDETSYCLKRIEVAFRMKKPAIISAHRLNFIGVIDQKNRDNNLRQFNRLLKEITQRWPEVEFLTSDRLGELMMKNQEGIF